MYQGLVQEYAEDQGKIKIRLGMESKKTLLIRITGLLVVLAGTWGFSPLQAWAGASCSYSGSLSWGGNCGATVNETVADGGGRAVNNTNPGYQGATTYLCDDGVFTHAGTDTCIVAGAASCGYSMSLAWNYLDPSGISYQCGAQINDATFTNGQSRTITNTLSGMTGSATYVCSNGQAILSGGMMCTPSGGGSAPAPPGGGGGTPTPPGGGSGGGTPSPPGSSHCPVPSTLSCSQYAGTLGIPAGYTEGTANIIYDACSYNFTYLGGCLAGGTGGGNTPGPTPGKAPDAPDCIPDNTQMATTCNTATFINNCKDSVFGTCKTQACCGIVLTPDTSCSQGACKGSCNTATETQVGTCNNNLSSCCVPKTVTPPVLTSSPWSNPVAFNTVEGLLDKILGYLQAIIVILSLIMIVIGSIVYMTAAGNDSKLSTGKLIITASLIGLALALAAPSFLKQIGDILGWTNTNVQNVQGAKTLIEILQSVLNFLLSIVGIIAIIMLVVGGIMYLTASGNEDKIKTGKTIVTYSLIGVAISLAALVIVTQVIGFFS